jgi:hypothetical protein
MLNKKIIISAISALALTVCTSVMLASCGGNGDDMGGNGSESTVETTKKETNTGVIDEVSSDIGSIVDDVTDKDNLEDATHGTTETEEETTETESDSSRHHRTYPNGK